MKKHFENAHPGPDYRLNKAPPVETIRARGEYRLRLTSLSIVFVLAVGGIVFSLLYPDSLPEIWSVITPIILTILGLAMKGNGKGNTPPK